MMLAPGRGRGHLCWWPLIFCLFSGLVASLAILPKQARWPPDSLRCYREFLAQRVWARLPAPPEFCAIIHEVAAVSGLILSPKSSILPPSTMPPSMCGAPAAQIAGNITKRMIIPKALIPIMSTFLSLYTGCRHCLSFLATDKFI